LVHEYFGNITYQNIAQKIISGALIYYFTGIDHLHSMQWGFSSAL